MMYNFNKAPLNTEIEHKHGKFTAFCLNFNPNKKEYSWTLFFPTVKEGENVLDSVQPYKITGQVKNWTNLSEAISSLKHYIKGFSNG